jgi:hypothetical protein
MASTDILLQIEKDRIKQIKKQCPRIMRGVYVRAQEQADRATHCWSEHMPLIQDDFVHKDLSSMWQE